MDGALLDGTSDLRPARIAEDVEIELRRKAALAVAHNAVDADDCVQLLAMLGLAAADGKGTT